MKLLLELNHQAKLNYLKSKGIEVKDMDNGKVKIEDPKDRIEDFLIYDAPEKAIPMAYSIAKSWLDD